MTESAPMLTILHQILARLDGMDQRLDGMDQRLDGMNQRFDGTDQRFDGMDQRFDGMDQRFDRVDQAVEANRLTLREHEVVMLEIAEQQAFTIRYVKTLAGRTRPGPTRAEFDTLVDRVDDLEAGRD